MRRMLLLVALLVLGGRNVAGQSALLTDTDLAGMDYVGVDLATPDPELCRKQCDDDTNCRSFTYVKPGVHAKSARCYLKSGVPKSSPNDCCVSGIKDTPATVQTPEKVAVQKVPAGDPCDRDHDGFKSVACGGSDCNDNDSYRYPGNPERCGGTLPDGRSAADHDEDCNPCTVAGSAPDGDADADGVLASRCVNQYSGSIPSGCDPRVVRIHTGGARVIGADCDDSNRAIVPGSQTCVPSDPAAVRICVDRAQDTGVIDWEIRRCPAGPDGSPGRCMAQPNGTGICVN